ncbi:MAG: hypothetical protein HRT44_06655 [Bdellovibrionales bacterium]|nr:hypothetical protein [Bdellovibrionales bacterium]
MKISPQQIKAHGKLYGWRFVYYDKKAKRPRYLKKTDHPEIANITTKQEALDFANKWNQKEDQKKAEFKAKRKRELYTDKFDFLDAVDKFGEFQKEFDKSYVYTVQKVELILNRLINVHKTAHPADFTELLFRETLGHIKEQRGLSSGGFRKYRSAFNKFLNFLYESRKIDYEQLRLIPISTVKTIEKNEANKHGKTARTLGKSPTSLIKPQKKNKKAFRLSLKELLQLLEFSIKYPEIIPESYGRLYFIAGTVGLRRGALLALQRRNIEIREHGRMYIIPDQTIQRFEREGN